MALGSGVSLSNDGNTALVGANSESSWKGAAYVFSRSCTTWTYQYRLNAGDAANSNFYGADVSLTGVGTTGIVGAYGASAVYINAW